MKRLILALTFGAFAAGSASAQLRLTLDDAIQMALSENPTIKVADLDVERYDYDEEGDARQSAAVAVGERGVHPRDRKVDRCAAASRSAPTIPLPVRPSLSVPLFAPAVYRTLKLNRTQIASAVEAARSSRITLVAEVKKAFYNILLARTSRWRHSKSRVRPIQRTVDDTKVKFEQGVASEYDYLTAQVELSNLLPTITQTKNSIRVAMLQLKMYLVGSRGVVDRAGRQPRRDERRRSRGRRNALDRRVAEQRSARIVIQAEMLRYQLKTTNAARIPTRRGVRFGDHYR